MTPRGWLGLGGVALLGAATIGACQVETVAPVNTFELRGLHSDLPCEACHPTDEPLGALPTDCASCHEDDAPANHYEGPCEECHDEFGWGTAVDHSFFPLDDAHALACESCHTADGFEGLSSLCTSCHEEDRPDPGHHPGLECSICHVPTTWSDAVDHSFFPLDQSHAVACIECHPNQPDFTGNSPVCSSCHETERPPPNHFPASDCIDCHPRTTWADGTIDHAFFPLADSHAGVDCASCHPAAPGDFDGASPLCASCHEGDRPDPGHFPGQECGACHSPTAWSDVAGVTHDFFPLTGQHALACTTCHPAAPNDYSGLTQVCTSCHEVDRPGCHFTAESCDGCHDYSASWLQTAQGINHASRFVFPVPHHTASQCADCHDTPNSQCDFNCLDCHDDAPNDHTDVGGFQNTSLACISSGCHPDGTN